MVSFFRKSILLGISIFVFVPIFSQNILVIGDSNAALPGSWVTYVKNKLPQANIINQSIPGNTIGFDNNGQTALNTLKNIHSDLEKAAKAFRGELPDQVIISLGTNDCKKVFDGMESTVIANMYALLDSVRQFYAGHTNVTILILSPPPASPDDQLLEKYKGMNNRVGSLTGKYKTLASAEHVDFLNIYHVLKPVFPYITIDGIHLNREGQTILARIILEYLNKDN